MQRKHQKCFHLKKLKSTKKKKMTSIFFSYKCQNIVKLTLFFLPAINKGGKLHLSVSDDTVVSGACYFTFKTRCGCTEKD